MESKKYNKLVNITKKEQTHRYIEQTKSTPRRKKVIIKMRAQIESRKMREIQQNQKLILSKETKLRISWLDVS